MQPVVPFLTWVMEHVDRDAHSVMKNRNLVAKNAFVSGESKNNCWMRSKQFKRSEDFASVVHITTRRHYLHGTFFFPYMCPFARPSHL